MGRHNPMRRRTLWLLACVGLLHDSNKQGSMASTSESAPLVWQGAADRKPSHFVPIRVTTLKKEGSGLFGLRNSPSMAGALPDPHILEGQSIAGGSPSSVTLRVPGGELPSGLKAGDRLVLGLVDARHVICFLVPPASVPVESLSAWAADQNRGVR